LPKINSMALIAMAVYSTAENKKDAYLDQTLSSLYKTVNFSKHRLILSVNSFTGSTLDILGSFKSIISKTIFNEKNIGTAEAINLAWKERQVGEHAVKMDDDIVIHTPGWLDQLEYIIAKYPTVGQAGLKRKDCIETPWSEGFYKSQLIMYPHRPGERWTVIEDVNHVMGSCVLHSASLLDKIGYLWQPGVYGFDDSFMSLRSKLAGFFNVFVPHIEIDHIDPGDTPYQKWKELKASENWNDYIENHRAFSNGTKPLYYNPFK
jgi:GT2 family glycosyltransferase